MESNASTSWKDTGPSSLPILPSPQEERSSKGQLSPLTGSYLLIVISEAHSEEDREKIIQRLTKGLQSWDTNSSHVDLNCELLNLSNSAPEGDDSRNGEKLVQWASESLVVEVLIHAQVNTLLQCMKNLLSSFTRHRHIIHAGYSYQGSGSWLLQDGTFSITDFIELWDEPEVARILSAYKGDISLALHCAAQNGWTDERFRREAFTKLCQVEVNGGDRLSGTHNAGLLSFVDYISKLVIPAPLKEVLQSSDIVGNIRFSHPTLYVFPGGQGDAALFGVNGFNMLIDGGFSRRACFWDFTRHLDRLDAVLLTRVNNNSMGGLGALLERKGSSQVYPQIGHFFGNVLERKGGDSSEQKLADDLIISLTEQGHHMFEYFRGINMKPQFCFRENIIEPINLYHKVGHGKLDLFVLNPAKDSRELKEFLSKWKNDCGKAFGTAKMNIKVEGQQLSYPILNLVSICALVVWQPANPRDRITRILFPGSTPQQKIFDSLTKLKHLEYLRFPVCTAKSIAASHKSNVKSDRVMSEVRHNLKTKTASSSTESRVYRTSSTHSAASLPKEAKGAQNRAEKQQLLAGTGTELSSSPPVIKGDEGIKKDKAETRKTETTKSAVSKVISSSSTVDNKLKDRPTRFPAPTKKAEPSTGVTKTSSVTRVPLGPKPAPAPAKKAETGGKQPSPTSPKKSGTEASEAAPAKTTQASKPSVASQKYGISKSVSKAVTTTAASVTTSSPKQTKEATNRKVVEHKVLPTQRSLPVMKAGAATLVEKPKAVPAEVKPKAQRPGTAKPAPPPASTAPKTNGTSKGITGRVVSKKAVAGAVTVASAATVAAISVGTSVKGVEPEDIPPPTPETNGQTEESPTEKLEPEREALAPEETTGPIEKENGTGTATATESSSEMSSLDHVEELEDRPPTVASSVDEHYTAETPSSSYGPTDNDTPKAERQEGTPYPEEEDEYLVVEKPLDEDVDVEAEAYENGTASLEDQETKPLALTLTEGNDEEVAGETKVPGESHIIETEADVGGQEAEGDIEVVEKAGDGESQSDSLAAQTPAKTIISTVLGRDEEELEDSLEIPPIRNLEETKSGSVTSLELEDDKLEADVIGEMGSSTQASSSPHKMSHGETSGSPEETEKGGNDLNLYSHAEPDSQSKQMGQEAIGIERDVLEMEDQIVEQRSPRDPESGLIRSERPDELQIDSDLTTPLLKEEGDPKQIGLDDNDLEKLGGIKSPETKEELKPKGGSKVEEDAYIEEAQATPLSASSTSSQILPPPEIARSGSGISQGHVSEPDLESDGYGSGYFSDKHSGLPDYEPPTATEPVDTEIAPEAKFEVETSSGMLASTQAKDDEPMSFDNLKASFSFEVDEGEMVREMEELIVKTSRPLEESKPVEDEKEPELGLALEAPVLQRKVSLTYDAAEGIQRLSQTEQLIEQLSRENVEKEPKHFEPSGGRAEGAEPAAVVAEHEPVFVKPEEETSLPQEKVGENLKESAAPVPSAIPSKLPRDLKDLIRTPDEMAELPVHEEVEPGSYELDSVQSHQETDEEEEHGVESIEIARPPVPPGSPKPQGIEERSGLGTDVEEPSHRKGEDQYDTKEILPRHEKEPGEAVKTEIESGSQESPAGPIELGTDSAGPSPAQPQTTIIHPLEKSTGPADLPSTELGTGDLDESAHDKEPTRDRNSFGTPDRDFTMEKVEQDLPPSPVILDKPEGSRPPSVSSHELMLRHLDKDDDPDDHLNVIHEEENEASSPLSVKALTSVVITPSTPPLGSNDNISFVVPERLAKNGEDSGKPNDEINQEPCQEEPEPNKPTGTDLSSLLNKSTEQHGPVPESNPSLKTEEGPERKVSSDESSMSSSGMTVISQLESGPVQPESEDELETLSKHFGGITKSAQESRAGPTPPASLKFQSKPVDKAVFYVGDEAGETQEELIKSDVEDDEIYELDPFGTNSAVRAGLLTAVTAASATIMRRSPEEYAENVGSSHSSREASPVRKDSIEEVPASSTQVAQALADHTKVPEPYAISEKEEPHVDEGKTQRFSITSEVDPIDISQSPRFSLTSEIDPAEHVDDKGRSQRFSITSELDPNDSAVDISQSPRFSITSEVDPTEPILEKAECKRFSITAEIQPTEPIVAIPLSPRSSIASELNPTEPVVDTAKSQGVSITSEVDPTESILERAECKRFSVTAEIEPTEPIVGISLSQRSSIVLEMDPAEPVVDKEKSQAFNIASEVDPTESILEKAECKRFSISAEIEPTEPVVAIPISPRSSIAPEMNPTEPIADKLKSQGFSITSEVDPAEPVIDTAGSQGFSIAAEIDSAEPVVDTAKSQILSTTSSEPVRDPQSPRPSISFEVVPTESEFQKAVSPKPSIGSVDEPIFEKMTVQRDIPSISPLDPKEDSPIFEKVKLYGDLGATKPEDETLDSRVVSDEPIFEKVKLKSEAVSEKTGPVFEHEEIRKTERDQGPKYESVGGSTNISSLPDSGDVGQKSEEPQGSQSDRSEIEEPLFEKVVVQKEIDPSPPSAAETEKKREEMKEPEEKNAEISLQDDHEPTLHASQSRESPLKSEAGEKVEHSNKEESSALDSNDTEKGIQDTVEHESYHSPAKTIMEETKGISGESLPKSIDSPDKAKPDQALPTQLFVEESRQSSAHSATSSVLFTSISETHKDVGGVEVTQPDTTDLKSEFSTGPSTIDKGRTEESLSSVLTEASRAVSQVIEAGLDRAGGIYETVKALPEDKGDSENGKGSAQPQPTGLHEDTAESSSTGDTGKDEDRNENFNTKDQQVPKEASGPQIFGKEVIGQLSSLELDSGKGESLERSTGTTRTVAGDLRLGPGEPDRRGQIQLESEESVRETTRNLGLGPQSVSDIDSSSCTYAKGESQFVDLGEGRTEAPVHFESDSLRGQGGMKVGPEDKAHSSSSSPGKAVEGESSVRLGTDERTRTISSSSIESSHSQGSSSSHSQTLEFKSPEKITEAVTVVKSITTSGRRFSSQDVPADIAVVTGHPVELQRRASEMIGLTHPPATFLPMKTALEVGEEVGVELGGPSTQFQLGAMQRSSDLDDAKVELSGSPTQFQLGEIQTFPKADGSNVEKVGNRVQESTVFSTSPAGSSTVTKSKVTESGEPGSSFYSSVHEYETFTVGGDIRPGLDFRPGEVTSTFFEKSLKDLGTEPGGGSFFSLSQHQQELMEDETYSSGEFSDSQLSTMPQPAMDTDEESLGSESARFSGLGTNLNLKRDVENGNLSSTSKVTSTTTRIISQSLSSSTDNGNREDMTLLVRGDMPPGQWTTTTTTTIKSSTDGGPPTEHTTTEVTGSGLGSKLPEPPKPEPVGEETDADLVAKKWGKPLGLPAVHPEDTALESSNPEGRGTPRRDGKASAKTPSTPKAAAHQSRRQYRTRHTQPIYLDLAYVPHHGNSNYCDSEFFRLIRSRYYVMSGLEPSREVFDGLLRGKQEWEDKNLDVTIVPTYDTDTLGYWATDSEAALGEARIDLAPSASRCTINLQDHETSCSAYRLEF